MAQGRGGVVAHVTMVRGGSAVGHSLTTLIVEREREGLKVEGLDI